MTEYTYPHTIDNGAGERLTFLRRAEGPEGERLEVENFVSPGSGPPMHVHQYQQEALTVQQGRIGYQGPGEGARFAEAGETVVFQPGEVHTFWNAGDDDLICTGYVQPPDNIEYFLGAFSSDNPRPDIDMLRPHDHRHVDHWCCGRSKGSGIASHARFLRTHIY